MSSTDHSDILYTSRREVCKISIEAVEHIISSSTPNFGRMSNSIEMPLVGGGLVSIETPSMVTSIPLKADVNHLEHKYMCIHSMPTEHITQQQ